MLTRIALALALVIAALAAVPALTGPGEGGQAASSYDGNMRSGGGNLVPLW